jgi:hypothetical protein
VLRGRRRGDGEAADLDGDGDLDLGLDLGIDPGIDLGERRVH